jgi:hypothetical protein
MIINLLLRHDNNDPNYLYCLLDFVMVTDDSHMTHICLIIDTEESLASRSFLPLVLVEKLVKIAPVRLSSTVQVVPPVTHKILLGEDGPIRAEKASGLSTGRAHVEGLNATVKTLKDPP